MNTNNLWDQLSIAAKTVEAKIGRADVAIVLGSGLGQLVKVLGDCKEIAYETIPYFPIPSVSGHAGKLFNGNIIDNNNITKVLCFSGRVHPYEGYLPFQVNFSIRLAYLLGCKSLILTNAAGGCLKSMKSGCVMIVEDFIKVNHFSGLSDTYMDTRFGSTEHLHTDNIFSRELIKMAIESAQEEREAEIKADSLLPPKVETEKEKKENIVKYKLMVKFFEHHLGNYCFTGGPTFETKAEVIAGLAIGAGSFGMSTVSESLAAASLGMPVCAISYITNIAAGLSETSLNHKEVKDAGVMFGEIWRSFTLRLLKKVGRFNVNVVIPPCNPNQSISDNLSLISRPLTPFIPPLKSVQVTTDKFLELNSGGKQFPRVLVVLPKEVSKISLLDTLEDVRTINLVDLPITFDNSFPFQRGVLVFGSLSGTRLAFVTSIDIMGLSRSESMVLLTSLHNIGCKIAIEVLLALDNEVDGSSPFSISLLNDYFNRSCQSTLPISGRLPSTPLFSKKLHDLFYKFDKTLKSKIYMRFDGPHFPTKADRSYGSKIGCRLFGISSLSPLFAAHALGMNCLAISVGSNRSSCESFIQAGIACNKKLSELLSNLIREIETTTFHDASVIVEEKNLEFHEPNLKFSSAYLDSKNEVQILRLPPILNNTIIKKSSVSGSIDNLKQEGPYPDPESLCCGQGLALFAHAKIAAKYCYNYLGLSSFDVRPRTALIVDNRILSPSFHISINCELIPYWSDCGGQGGSFPTRNSKWNIGIGSLKEQTPLVCIAENYSCKTNEEQDIYEEREIFGCLGFGQRMLYAMGVRNFVMVVPLTSICEDLKLGDVVLVTDHIGGGINPLRGPNEDRFTLFPPMEANYSSKINTNVKEIGKELGLSIKETNVLQLPSGIISPSDVKFAKMCDATSVCNGLIPQICILRHMRASACVIGVITKTHLDTGETFFGYKKHVRLNSEKVLLLNSLIASLNQKIDTLVLSDFEAEVGDEINQLLPSWSQFAPNSSMESEDLSDLFVDLISYGIRNPIKLEDFVRNTLGIPKKKK